MLMLGFGTKEKIGNHAWFIPTQEKKNIKGAEVSMRIFAEH